MEFWVSSFFCCEGGSVGARDRLERRSLVAPGAQREGRDLPARKAPLSSSPSSTLVVIPGIDIGPRDRWIMIPSETKPHR